MSNLKSVSWGNDIPRSKWDDTEESESSSSENSGRTYTRQPDVYIQLKPEVEVKQPDDSGLPPWMWIALGVAGVAGLGFMGTGLCGYFKVGALSTMGGCSYLCMTAGGLMIPMGAASLIKLVTSNITREKKIELDETYCKRIFDWEEKKQVTEVEDEDLTYQTFGMSFEELAETNVSEQIPPSIDNPSNLGLKPNEYTIIPIGEDCYEIYTRGKETPAEHFTTVQGVDALLGWKQVLKPVYNFVEIED